MKILLATTMLIITLMGLWGCRPNKDDRFSQPNFVLIFVDDLGYGDLGCYGHPTIRTPHLDQMAAEGMKLTQFYNAASLCTPSRAGLLTGKLPVRTGLCGKRGVLFPDSEGGLPSSEASIASALKTVGYRNACIGKWHLGHLPEYLPTEHGFDEFFGIPYSNDMSPDQTNWDYAKEHFPPLPLMEGNQVIETEPDQAYLTRRYTDRAIEFIEQNQEQPFFLYLAHTFPHAPLYVDSLNAGRSKRGLYGDVVEVLDENVGRILAALKQMNLDKNTFVLFTSDNGPWEWKGKNGGSAGLLRGAKGSPWEGGFRVPAIAWMPGTVPANVQCDALAATLDIFPTFLTMGRANISLYDYLDGQNIYSTFTEQKAIRSEVFYYRQNQLSAYRRGPWKIHLQNPNPWNDEFKDADIPLLYHLEEDPSEKYNVAQEHPDLIEELTQFAQKHLDSFEPAPSQLESIIGQ